MKNKDLTSPSTYLDNIHKYLLIGSAFKEDEKAYRKNSFAPLLLTFALGYYPGIILKGYWGYMTFAMILISLACVIIVFKLSSFALTLRDSFWADVVISGTWVLDFSILELMYFTIWKGFTPWFLLIYLPVVLIPLLFGIKIYTALKKPDYNPKETSKSNTKTAGFFYGILGMNFAAIFRNVDQSTAFIVGLLCFSIVNGFMSLGLLSLQRLYYMKKFKINM